MGNNKQEKQELGMKRYFKGLIMVNS